MAVLESTVTEAYDLFSKKEFESALDLLANSEPELDKELAQLEETQKEEFSSSLQNMRGFIFLGMGDNTSAQACFEKALQENPHSSQACAGLGEVLFLQEKDEEAKMMYEWALDLNNENEFARSGLVKVNKLLNLPSYHNSLENDSLTEEELTIFNKCISDAYVLFKDRVFKESLEKINLAEEVLTGGVMSNSTLLKISSLENFKGFNYLALENYDEAQYCFEKALNLDQKSSQACAGLGELYYLKGMDKEAKTMFEFAIINDDRNDFAVTGLAKVNKILGFEENHNSKLEK